ncbi:MAG: urea ABC transporter substrate-binding protein [Rhodoluna sp.]|jgi:urea transport system substrate-binding protein|nr:urea ABC transporter substrate-binding protein [Rhodoluna sp.]
MKKSDSKYSKTKMAVAFASVVALGLSATAATSASAATASCVVTTGKTIKVGFLNSLSGTMAISEKTVQDAQNLAVKEINAAGGVNGKKITVVQEDGASDPATFAQKAQKLIQQDCVAAVFGGWTSSSRKAMLPVFESNNSLLFYPVQYEGLESSKNIYYTGATTNQQIIPALDYLKTKKIKKIFLVGSDYVFPRTANKEIKAYAAANGMTVVGEEYAPLGSTDFTTIANKLKSAGAEAILNTINGDSNVAFFKQYGSLGLNAKNCPVISFSIGEEEVKGVGLQYLKGQYTAWNYYQTVKSAANTKFVAAFKKEYGSARKTSDPMEASYAAVNLWALMATKAKSFTTDAINKAAAGTKFVAPEGTVVVDGSNHHITKTPLIGIVNAAGLIDTVWKAPKPVTPDPYLTGYTWAKGLK